MLQIDPRAYLSLDDPDLLIAVLEQHRASLPFATKELERHQALRDKIEEQQWLSERALAAWRDALARRWECEVDGQRLYMRIQAQLRNYFGADARYLQLVAPINNGAASTAVELLANLRRTEASLALMQPRPDFVAERLAQLTVVCNNLSDALNKTDQCEAERRRAMLGHRLARNAYQQVCVQTRRMLVEHLGEGVLAAP